MRLGILTSHPIQYQAPWFRALARKVEVEVFFAHQQAAAEQADFGLAFEWDVDLLGGYRNRFLKNVAVRPGVNHFSGCDNPELAGLVQQGGFDAFLVNGWYLKSYLQAARACRRARVPVLVRGDSQLRTPRSWPKRLAMEVRQRWLLRKFDGFLTVGRRNREYLEHFGVRPEALFFVPHFVDNEWFAARCRERPAGHRAAVRRSWGAGENEVVALFVGKFIAKKRPADLLRALVARRIAPATSATQLRTSAPTGAEVLAVFVGAGALEAELRALAAREGVRAHFAGFKNQTELPECYAAADVLVLPSDGGETWGLVVNEAMACGCPAIVSDAVGCGPDLITDGETGYVFPLGEVGALAERLGVLVRRKAAGHDFVPALVEKLRTYSLLEAVNGTLQAAETVARRRN